MALGRGMTLSVVLLCAVGLISAGCRESPPHSFAWPYSGDQIPSHPEPPEGGYYSNWDPYAATIEVTPVVDTNPVQTQHILIATVKDKDGKPLPNRRVEWMIPDGSIGTFVEVDESGWRASRGYKMTNTFAVTHTNNDTHVLTRGNDDPSDDIQLEPGQTWAVITSAVEGVTHVIAYAPGIYDWQKHKVFVRKYWRDVDYTFPPAATNPIGTTHTFSTKVHRASDGGPLAGYRVKYEILDGPDGVWAQSNGKTAVVKTGADGMANVTLKQSMPKAGTNNVAITVMLPETEEDAEVPLAAARTYKRWIAPDIKISKSAPPRAMVGDEFQYAISVWNPAQTAATNVVLTDNLPDGVSYVSSEPRAQVSGRKLTWKLGNIDGGQRVSGTVTVKAAKIGTHVNTANVTANYGLSGQAQATTVVVAAGLKLEKSGPDEALVGQTVPYQLVVSNPGSGDATNVKVVDKLPAGIHSGGKQDLEFVVGTLAAGASRTLRYNVTTTKAGRFTNRAAATADRGLRDNADHTIVVKEPKLTLAKTGPAQQYIGRNVTWKLTARSTGSAPAANTMLVDTLPAGCSFVSASNGGQYSGGKVTWNLGTMKPGASKDVSVTVRADQITTLVNPAVVTATGAQAEAQAKTVIVGIPAILLEMVDTADPIEVGDNGSYTITVTNQGSAEDRDIVVACTLPGELSFVSADGPTKGTAKGKKVTFAPLTRLAPKARATYTVTVKANKAGDVRFRVSLTSKELKTPVEESEATRVYAE